MIPPKSSFSNVLRSEKNRRTIVHWPKNVKTASMTVIFEKSKSLENLQILSNMVSFVFHLPLIDTTEHVQTVLRYFNLSFNNSVCYNCFLLCRTTLQRQILRRSIFSSLIMSSYKRTISWFKNYKLNGWKILQFWHECVMLSKTDLRDSGMDVSGGIKD